MVAVGVSSAAGCGLGGFEGRRGKDTDALVLYSVLGKFKIPPEGNLLGQFEATVALGMLKSLAAPPPSWNGRAIPGGLEGAGRMSLLPLHWVIGETPTPPA